MKINLQKLSTKVLATLAERTINSSKKGQYKIVENHELLQEIEKEYELYEKVYAKLTYSGKGQSIAEADAQRDKLFAGIKIYIRGFERLPNMPGYADAMALLEVFKTYGLDLDKLNYAAETAQMNKLLADLEKPGNAAKLKTLNLTEYTAQLKQAQADFEALYAEQAEANADLHQMPSATSIRKSLEAALRNYYNLLTAMKNVESWKLLYADINEIVKAAASSSLAKPEDKTPPPAAPSQE